MSIVAYLLSLTYEDRVAYLTRHGLMRSGLAVEVLGRSGSA